MDRGASNPDADADADADARTWDLPPAMSGLVREETLYIDASTVREVPTTTTGMGT